MGTDNIEQRRKAENKEKRKKAKESRKANTRKVIPKILILTEGISEKHYFESLKFILDIPNVTVQKSTHTDSYGIVTQAIKLARKAEKEGDFFGYIFCVFDLDTVKDKRFLEVLVKYNKSNNNTKIIPVYTFPCIELWFILHFEFYDKPFVSTQLNSIGTNVKDALVNYTPNYYETNESCINSIAGNYKTAIFNATELFKQQQKVDSINPITNIHQLVLLLIEISNRSNNYQYSFGVDNYILSKINQSN
ncbi:MULTISPECIES: RloB family protein [unclassified Moraxella]|uniref:RloB family protein n=1 Tax=unclassified Moraxella TaxID=2685852 RepID=UPI003AF5320D